jgi:hypothetical protein
MGRKHVTADPYSLNDADSIVLPVTLTIPAPKRPAQSGMSRLEPIKVFPANGWPGAQSAVSNTPFSLAKWFGISSAQAQKIPLKEEEIARRGAGSRSLTAEEEFRLELYNAATRRLIALDPKNPELRSVASQDYIPDEPALARRQSAVAEAERKASGATRDGTPPRGSDANDTEADKLTPATPPVQFGDWDVASERSADLKAGRWPLDPADIVAPVGERFRPGRGSPPEFVRTVSKVEFEAIKG